MSTDTFLIECSHNNAIIKDPSNNTYYTNQVGDGIRLNVGDKVSVHSAYIHEIGSGSESIEFDGETVGEQSVSYTNTIKNNIIPSTQDAFVETLGISGSKTFTVITTAPLYYASQIYTLDDIGDGNGNSIDKADGVIILNTSVNVVDGHYSQTIEINKNLNKNIDVGVICYIVNSWLATNPDQYVVATNSSYSYTMKDNLINISYSYYKNADAKNCMILPRLYFANQPFPNDEFDRYKEPGDDLDDGVPVNFGDFSNNPQDDDTYLHLYRRTHDNARYKIFEMTHTVPSVLATRNPLLEPNPVYLAIANQLDTERDIALRDYIPYQDKIEFSIPSGYNTPSNIAEDLTSQLHKAPSLQTKTKTIPNKAQDGTTLDVDLSVVIPSPTLKQFQCACVSTYNSTAHNSNINDDVINNTTFYSSKEYLQAYKHIGVYDPELFMAGRKLEREGYLIRKTIETADRDTAEIIINMEYTKDNLLLWKAIFDAQAKRNDLIFGTNITTTNCRFIHMNPDNMLQGVSGGLTDANSFLWNRLGDDGLRVNPSYGNAASIWHNKTGQSARQYINYGYGSTSTFLDASDSNLDDNNLCYGFAKSTTVDELDYVEANGTMITKPINYITFLTNHVGGIQSKIKLPIQCGVLPPTKPGSNGTSIDVNITNFKTHHAYVPVGTYPATSQLRFCGWDWHFSAYGNDATILWSGYVADGPVRQFKESDGTIKQTADYKNIITTKIGQNGQVVNPLTDATTFQTYAFIDWITLGADDPLINFSPTGSRFTISQLHTCPRQGNLPLAGRDSITDPAQNFPDNSSSHNPVYHINPLINRGNTGAGMFSYNPEVRQLPIYDNGYANSGNISTSTLCKRWTIFDSQTGISIDDFGCDEASWSSSMWYKIGFDYSQLNSNTYNLQGRSTNTTQSFFPITSNADVNATQSLALMVNTYDGSQYTLQSPISGVSVLSKGHYLQILNPVITETQSSTVLTASRKPSKQIYGYYLIRSSLIDNSQFFSENVMLPVISVISKNYTGADFVFSDDASDEFTVTKAKTISNITTAIYKPDGKIARADSRSCIIYKIQKAINYNPNILEDIMNKK